MKTVKLSDIRARNMRRRVQTIKAVRSLYPDFVLGMRKFDTPRKNKYNQRILIEMGARDQELRKSCKPK